MEYEVFDFKIFARDTKIDTRFDGVTFVYKLTELAPNPLSNKTQSKLFLFLVKNIA